MRAATTEIAVATPIANNEAVQTVRRKQQSSGVVLQQTATQSSDNQPTHTENRVAAALRCKHGSTCTHVANVGLRKWRQPAGHYLNTCDGN